MNQKNFKRKVPKSGLRSNSKVRKMTESKHFELEELFLRFPLVGQLILINLDDQSLVKFNELSKELHHNDIKKRFVWIRIIKKYTLNFRNVHEEWKEIINKMPNEYLEKLANSTQEFSEAFLTKNIFKKDWFPVHIAAQQGDLKLCKFIVEKTGNRCSKKGFAPLDLAARMGHLEIYKFFSQGIDNINQGCDFNSTPLHTAASFGQYEMCQYIISNIKETNPKTKNGRTPLHLATMFGHLNICNLIIENTSDKNPAILKPGDPDEGKTPLHMAANFGRLDICRLLLTNATDKNPSDARGCTPLHYAARGWKPFHDDADCGNMEMCKLILSYVTDKNPINMDGKTPRDFACHKNIQKLFDN